MGLGGRAWRRLRDQIAAEESACWLCGLPIDFTLGPYLPGSFEVDHVLERRNGGDNERENLRASHRACNNKRNRNGGQVERVKLPPLRRRR